MNRLNGYNIFIIYIREYILTNMFTNFLQYELYFVFKLYNACSNWKLEIHDIYKNLIIIWFTK